MKNSVQKIKTDENGVREKPSSLPFLQLHSYALRLYIYLSISILVDRRELNTGDRVYPFQVSPKPCLIHWWELGSFKLF